MKRAYDAPARADGYRVLVDRLWPRGIKKEKLRLDEWAKELAPSTELRKWFGHDPEKWKEFRTRYRAELRNSAAKEQLGVLAKRARRSTVTLVYGASDPQHNNAAVLMNILTDKNR